MIKTAAFCHNRALQDLFPDSTGKGLQFNAEVKTNKGSSKYLKAEVEATQKSMQRLNVAVGENNPFFRDQKVNKQNKSTYDIKRYV